MVTLGGRSDVDFGRGEGLDVRRIGIGRSRHRSISALNVAAFREAARFRPRAVLCGHIVVSPGAVSAGRLLGIPVVQYAYGEEIGGRPALASFAVRHARATIVISRYTKDLAVEAGGSPSRMRLIPPGVDHPAIDGDRQVRRLLDGALAPVVVTVSRMQERYKGHDTMARAMPLVLSRVPGARWDVIGDGPLRPHIERLVEIHGIAGSVRFLGRVSDSERDARLAEARVFAMPSRLPAAGRAGEGFGIVYLEASARGIPVVAGRVAGALDAVVEGSTGLLVDPDDHVAVADAITALLTDRERAAAYAAAGMEHAKRFSWPEMGRRVAEVMHEVAPAP